MREPRGTPRSGRSPEGPKSRSRAKVTTNDHFGAEVESTAFDREDARRASAPRTAPNARSPARRDRDFAREPTLARAPVCPRGGRRTRATRCIPEPVSPFLAETPSHRRDPSSRNSRRRIVEAWVQISALRLPLSVGPSKVNEARLEVARRAAARTSARARDDGESPARESPAARVTRRARVATGDACASFASSDARCRIVSA